LQKVHIGGFDNYADTLAGKKFLSPSLIIIGRVVNLHQQFAWLPNSNSNEYYFKPVAKIAVKVKGEQKKKERA